MAIFKKKDSANGTTAVVSEKTELEKDGEKQFEREAAPYGFGNFFVSLTSHPFTLIMLINSPPANFFIRHEIRLLPNRVMRTYSCRSWSGMFRDDELSTSWAMTDVS